MKFEDLKHVFLQTELIDTRTAGNGNRKRITYDRLGHHLTVWHDIEIKGMYPVNDTNLDWIDEALSAYNSLGEL